MFPKDILEILEKYKCNNQSQIANINKNVDEIISCLDSINKSIVEQLQQLLIKRDTTNTNELLQDSQILCNYITSVKTPIVKIIEKKDEIKPTEKLIDEFPKTVFPYLLSDNVCPFCDVQLVNHNIYYTRIINDEISDCLTNGHRCPSCKKLFLIDSEIENFDFKNTNISINKNKYNPIPIPPIDIYTTVILSNELKCLVKHKCKGVIAKLPLINESGQISHIDVNALYCPTCKHFIILKDDFDAIKDIVFCKVIDETNIDSSLHNGSIKTQNQSILFQYGYNMQTEKVLSETQRHIILTSIIDGQILTKWEVVNHITELIDKYNKISSMKNIVQKLKEDKRYISEYQNNNSVKTVDNNISENDNTENSKENVGNKLAIDKSDIVISNPNIAKETKKCISCGEPVYMNSLYCWEHFKYENYESK